MRLRRLLIPLASASGLAASACGPAAPAATATPAATASTRPAAHDLPAAAPIPTAVASEMPCHARRRIGNISFSPDGHTLLTACAGYGVCIDPEGANARIDVWDLPGGRLLRSLDTGMENVNRISWGIGTFATVADPSTGNAEIRLFDTSTLDLIGSTELYCAMDIQFDPSGTLFAAAGCDGQIATIRTSDGAVTRRPHNEAHIGADYTLSITFGPDASTLFVDDEAGGMQVLDGATLKRRTTLQRAIGLRMCAAVSPRHDRLAATYGAGEIVVVDLADPTKPRTLNRGANNPCAVMTWVEPNRVAIAHASGAMTVWDTTAKPEKRSTTLEGYDSMITQLQADPSGTWLAGINTRGDVLIWNVATTFSKLVRRAPSPDPDKAAPNPPIIAWSPTGDRLAALFDAALIVYDAKSGAKVAERKVPIATGDPTLAWSATGKVVAASDGTLELLRPSDGATMTLAIVDRAGTRVGMAATDSGAFYGPPDLTQCIPPATIPQAKRVQRPTLISDFFAGLPVSDAPPTPK